MKTARCRNIYIYIGKGYGRVDSGMVTSVTSGLKKELITI